MSLREIPLEEQFKDPAVMKIIDIFTLPIYIDPWTGVFISGTGTKDSVTGIHYGDRIDLNETRHRLNIDSAPAKIQYNTKLAKATRYFEVMIDWKPAHPYQDGYSTFKVTVNGILGATWKTYYEYEGQYGVVFGANNLRTKSVFLQYLAEPIDEVNIELEKIGSGVVSIYGFTILYFSKFRKGKLMELLTGV